MDEIQDYHNIELILHVIADGTEENVYRKKELNKHIFFNSYSHIGLSKKDAFWSGHDDRFETWEQFWEEFSDLDEWWYFYKPIKIHPEYKDFILKELLEVTQSNKHLDDKGNINKWREMCIQ